MPKQKSLFHDSLTLKKRHVAGQKKVVLSESVVSSNDLFQNHSLNSVDQKYTQKHLDIIKKRLFSQLQHEQGNSFTKSMFVQSLQFASNSIVQRQVKGRSGIAQGGSTIPSLVVPEKPPTFYPLLYTEFEMNNLKPFVGLYSLNRDTKDLTRNIKTALDQGRSLRNDLDDLKNNEINLGPYYLEAVQKALPGIHRQLQVDPDFRNQLGNYLFAKRMIGSEIDSIQAKQRAINKAAGDIKMATIESKIESAKRRKEDAQTEVDAEKNRLKKAKKAAENIIDPMMSAIQGEWKETGISLYKLFAKNVFSSGWDYSYELRVAEQNLRQAKKRLKNLTDVKHSQDLENANIELKQRYDEYSAENQKLTGYIGMATLSQATLVRKFRKRGYKTAATALIAQFSIKELAARVNQDVITHQKLVELILKITNRTMRDFQGLLYTLSLDDASRWVPNKGNLAWLKIRAKANLKTLDDVKIWAGNELAWNNKLLGYVKKGSYMKDYETIYTELQGEAAIP